MPKSQTSSEAIRAIVDSNHSQPFSILGPHLEESSGSSRLFVRCFIPDARKVWIVESGGKLTEAERRHECGFFEAALEGKNIGSLYRIKLESSSGLITEFDDPYSFPSLLSDFDIHLMREGTHLRLWEKLGAHLETIRNVEGVHFAVWAPNARRVSVVGDFNRWDGRCHPMRKHESAGIWELFIPGLGQGANYKYEIKASNGNLLLKTDPYAFQVEVPPKTASVVHQIENFCWNDSAWMEKQRTNDFKDEPISIYEMHFGSWKRVPQENNRSLSYIEMAEELPRYIKNMGFTHVELLPMTEHPFYGSWGYQSLNYFAPTGRYGSANELRQFIDLMHQNDIGVILDWVPAHFPSDVYGLAQFDGTALYEHPNPKMARHPEWGTLVFDYGRREVTNFLIASALFWLEQYHFDGLRVDAVASLLYLDYARKKGQWIPNKHNGRENLEAVEFVKQLNAAIHREHPGVITIAEESTTWKGVSRPVEEGGLGFSMKWNMGWMHDTLDYFSKDPAHRSSHSNKLTFAMLYAYSEHFMLAFSHDEVVHKKRSLIGKMPGDDWQKRANVKTLLGFMYGFPGKKTMFMGMEIGQWREWSHDGSLEWHLLQSQGHEGIQHWVKDLNTIYKKEESLHQQDFDPAGFRWIDCSDTKNSVYSFVRFARDPSNFIVFVCNMMPIPRRNYRIGMPQNCRYLEILNSDAAVYGGSNVGNGGSVQAEQVPWHGLPSSVSLVLPPLGVLVLKPVNG